MLRSGGSPMGTRGRRSSCGGAACDRRTSGELAVRMLESVSRCLQEDRAAKSLPSFTLRREHREIVAQSSVTESSSPLLPLPDDGLLLQHLNRHFAVH